MNWYHIYVIFPKNIIEWFLTIKFWSHWDTTNKRQQDRTDTSKQLLKLIRTNRYYPPTPCNQVKHHKVSQLGFWLWVISIMGRLMGYSPCRLDIITLCIKLVSELRRTARGFVRRIFHLWTTTSCLLQTEICLLQRALWQVRSGPYHSMSNVWAGGPSIYPVKPSVNYTI
jgi:hypothetical protein